MTFSEGDKVYVEVNEPVDYLLDNGEGPFSATVVESNENTISFAFDNAILCNGEEIIKCNAVVRNTGVSFTTWDAKEPIIVNILLSKSIPGLTHLIGVISKNAL